MLEPRLQALPALESQRHGRQAAQGQGHSRGGFGSQLHVAVDAQGRPRCDADHLRARIAARGAESVIPGRKNRTVPMPCDLVLYRTRNVVERAIGFSRHHRHIATRHDKMADSFLGFVQLASALLWIKTSNLEPVCVNTT